MSRVWSFLLGTVTGAALLYTAMNYHIVRSSSGFNFVAKSPPRLSETFVDIRGFSMADWAGHPQLAGALVQAGKQNLVGDSAVGAIHESLNRLLPDAPVR
jgi:hypothetical protein